MKESIEAKRLREFYERGLLLLKKRIKIFKSNFEDRFRIYDNGDGSSTVFIDNIQINVVKGYFCGASHYKDGKWNPGLSKDKNGIEALYASGGINNGFKNVERDIDEVVSVIKEKQKQRTPKELIRSFEGGANVRFRDRSNGSICKRGR